MDEPTAALGVKEVSTLLRQINILKNQGISILFITHRLNDIFKIADRIVVMAHGKIKYDLLTSSTNLLDLTSKILE